MLSGLHKTEMTSSLLVSRGSLEEEQPLWILDMLTKEG